MRRALWIGLLLLGVAWAHGFHVEARWTGERVRVEAYFSSGDAPGSGQVVVRRGEAEVARGELDAQGAWTWTPPRAGRYRFEVTEPGLHKAFAEVEVPELDSAARVDSAVAVTPRPLQSAVAEDRGTKVSVVHPLWTRVKQVLIGLVVIGALALGLKVLQVSDPQRPSGD